MEGYVRLREVVPLVILTDANGGYEQDLRRVVRWFRERPDLAAFGDAAELMSAHHAQRKGEGAEVDALIARYGRATQQPQLLFAPAALQENTGRAPTAAPPPRGWRSSTMTASAAMRAAH